MTLLPTRRHFLKGTGAALTVSAFGFPALALPARKARLGVALVGLGGYSTGRLAPGLQQTLHCELRGIVTGSPEKIPVWQERYGILDRNVYSYETLDTIADNDEIDVVYIVTPPSLHARDAIRAAEAGKHVWCEKPMAMDEAECLSIIDAARQNGVSLSIGYRLHHEPNTQTIIRYGREETYGAVTGVATGAGFVANFPDPAAWRRVGALGGGALYDMGVYPINAARYATGLEPVAVRGRQWSERLDLFGDVDEYTTFDLAFPGGLAVPGETSFGKRMNYLDVDAEQGWYRLRPFMNYTGVGGETSDGTRLPPDPGHQQARQMDAEALAILEGRPPIAPGEEGLRDIRIVNAIQDSSEADQAWITL